MGDWGFWIAAGGMTLVVAASLIASLFQRREGTQPVVDHDIQVYRAQLAEVEQGYAAGTVAPAEADRLRIEISRRILEADKSHRAAATMRAPSTAANWAAGFGIALALGGAVWGYARIGAPGYGDLPLAARMEASAIYRATRPSQTAAEAATPLALPVAPDVEFEALMTKLRQAVKDRPADIEGLTLLARNEAALGNLDAARDAQVALIAAKDKAATGEDHAVLAELLIGLAGGFVSVEAEQELVTALELDPQNGMARYYTGMMFVQGDRADLAFQVWQGLLQTSAQDAPWVGPIRAGIEDLAARAGVDYTLPDASLPDAVGPSAAEVDAAAQMSAEDRRAMIETMVDGLSDRLAKDGGPATDWARLITSLGVLGDLPRATAIYAEAQTRFAGRAAELEELRLAAISAGVTE